MRILGFGLSIAALLGLSAQAQALDDGGAPPSGSELQSAAREQQRLARFEEAAASFEQAAARLPESDPESLSALRSAVDLRIRLGQPDQAQRVAASFAMRARHRPELVEEAAGLALAIAGLYEERGDDAALRRQLTEYLRSFGGRGGIDRQIIAEQMLGALAWRAACPIPGVAGACASPRTPSPSPAGCGPDLGLGLVAKARRPAQRAEALAHFERALALYKNGQAASALPMTARHREQRLETLAQRVAAAALSRSDDRFEQALRVLEPSTLRPAPATKGPPHVAPKQLGAWTQAGFNAVRETEKAYQAVLARPAIPSQIAAHGRIGQLYQTFIESLTAVPLPPLSTGPAPAGMTPAKWKETLRQAYCDTLRDNAEPLQDRAIAAFAACDARSVEQGRFGEWSMLCEQALSRLQPSAYPRRTDIHLAPIHSPYLLDAAPVFGQLGR